MTREEQILQIIEEEYQKCKDWVRRCQDAERKILERLNSGELYQGQYEPNHLLNANACTGVALECYKTVARIKDKISEL